MSTHKWVAVATLVTALLVASSSLAIGQGQPDSAAKVTALSPTTLNQNTTSLDVSVRGTGFSSKSKVRVDGTPRSTAFVSETELRATLSAEDVASAVSRSVSVFNPGAGNSNEVRLAIAAVVVVPPAAPPPSDGVAPLFQPALLADLRLTATSASGAVATLVAPNAVDNSGKVTVTVTPYAIGVPVTFPVGTNTANYRATDPSGNFATISQRIIVAPLPVAPAPPAPAPAPPPPAADTQPPRFDLPNLPNLLVAATSPTGAIVTPIMPRATDNSGSVTVTASNNNVPFDGPMMLQVGSYPIVYTATDPSGNKATLSNVITVGPQPPPMSISELAPASGVPGAPDFRLKVSGSGFRTGMVVRWNGASRVTAFEASSLLSARIPASDLVSFGKARVTVYDPSTSLETPVREFAIDAAASGVPRITTITPATGIAGSENIFSISGAGFIAGSVLRWTAAETSTTAGSMTTVIGSTSLLSHVPDPLWAHPATYTVKVFNAGSSGGESNGVTFVLSAAPQKASKLALASFQSQTGKPGENITGAPAVSVRDQFEKAMAGVVVNFSVTSGGGAITPASVVTDAGGIARTTSWRLGPNIGQNAVVAVSSGLPSLTFTATGEMPAPVARSFQAASSTSLSGSTGAAVTQPPAVIVRDQNGNPFAGANVSFTVIAGGGTLSPASQTTGADGIARLTSWTLGPNAGVNQVKASLPSTAFAATFTAKAPLTIAAFTKRADGTQLANAQICVGSRTVIDQYATVKDAGTFGRQTFNVEAVTEYGVTASKGGFTGKTVFFNPTANSGSVTIVLTPGSGGPICPGAVTSIDAVTSIPLPVTLSDHRVTVASYSVPTSGLSTGSVILTRTALAAESIPLKSSNTSVVTVPLNVAVQANSDRGTFAISPRGAGCATISATRLTATRAAYVVVHPASTTTSFTFTVPDALLPVGANAPASLALNSAFATPLGGVTLTSSNTSVATVPANPTLSRGVAAFTIATRSPGCAIITAQVGTQTIRRTIQVIEIGG